ncbi:MPT63 family protein [Mycobacterium sp. 1274756.6]|uniref:MPT63 family protein n=1 Tax=Mycobacterium sp. 1274756.6 TaxID=1834076 RepID=UPI0009ED48E9|nr:MPT63 family protein [Mycobacterium sp. 1274756.6]
MTIRNAVLSAVAAAGLAGAGIAAAPAALADNEPGIQHFGAQQGLVDADGGVSQEWTVSNLQPSSDVIGWPVQGQLWEANANVEAVRGCPLPIISNFNARAGDGETYQVLATANAPQGISPRTICAPDHSQGKLYFDVIGAQPDGVVYRADNRDLLIWTNTP